MQNKIAIIGAGHVGTTAAHLLLQKELGDIVLLDIVEGIPQGVTLDLMQSGAVEGYKTKIKGTNSYNDITGADIVLITAGFPRKPGMDRLDLLKRNAHVIEEIVKNIILHCPESIMVMMTNPVDILTYHALKLSGFKHNKVMGQAGVLDTARFVYFLSAELNVHPSDIKTIVIGGHGDTMEPLPRLTTVKGRALTELLSAEKIKVLIEKTMTGGAEIIALLKTGSAFYAPAISAVSMIESILKNTRDTVPASVYLDGAYGIHDVCIGVPVKLGRNGVEEIVELKLDQDELSALHKSALLYKENIKELWS